ncbi:MAG: hypothetical protein U0694_00915 [Anaerolineae bacterium]
MSIRACLPTVIPHGSDITVGYGMGMTQRPKHCGGHVGQTPGDSQQTGSLCQFQTATYIENTAPNGAPFSVQNVFHWGTPDAGTYNLIATDRAAVQTCIGDYYAVIEH